MGLSTKSKAPKKSAKAVPFVPYEGIQQEINFSSCTENGQEFDFSAFNQAELVGSQSDDLESSAIRKALGPKKADPTWGEPDPRCVVPEQNHPKYIFTQRVWHGSEPLLPMDYPSMNFKGMRGGLMTRSLSGIYIGPEYTTQKNRRTLIHKASPLAGPYPFPFVKTVSKAFLDRRVADINEYVGLWEAWWEGEGRHLPQCQKELQMLLAQFKQWKSLTLLHWCRPIDPLNPAEKRLRCPSITIIKALEGLMAEEF